ncbi:unnamed protein product [Peronospora belbahrii]|uniref:Uncharacterized protein n=1 Tax=Peronospora belbahrii TaxID=622444 RepID=A0ABN8D6R8_9STRA|nr:unnamed protein product [Peronospora belbahrii]
MLHYKGVLMVWWAEAVNTAVYLINRFTNTQNATVVFKVKPTLDYLCVFNFRGYAQNFKGYRVYDLDAFNIKVCRSVKLDKREVGGIYDTLPPQNEPVTQVTTDVDEAVTLAPLERQPVEAKPMQGVENDALFEEDRVVFHTPINRYRRPREPVFLLEDGTDAEEERKSEGNGGPSSPKRVRIDEDGPIAEAVLAYAASIDDLSTTLQHWSAAIRVLRYFKTTHQHGIIHKSGTSSVSAEAYSDAEWGYNLDDRRSVSGVMIMIGNSPVVFKSKFQRTIALSSAEAGYMALKPMRLGSTVDACDADGHGNGTKERYYDLVGQSRRNCLDQMLVIMLGPSM